MPSVLIALLLAAASAAAPPPAKPPAKAASFDARDPAALIGLLKSTGAQAEVMRASAEEVVLKVETPGGGFGIQYVDCGGQRRACRALAFSTAFERKSVSLAQINDFNRGQIACRGFLAEDGAPNIAYAALLSQRMSAEELKLHVGAWQGCLATFSDFTRDPTAFLALGQ